MCEDSLLVKVSKICCQQRSLVHSYGWPTCSILLYEDFLHRCRKSLAWCTTSSCGCLKVCRCAQLWIVESFCAPQVETKTTSHGHCWEPMTQVCVQTWRNLKPLQKFCKIWFSVESPPQRYMKNLCKVFCKMVTQGWKPADSCLILLVQWFLYTSCQTLDILQPSTAKVSCLMLAQTLMVWKRMLYSKTVCFTATFQFWRMLKPRFLACPAPPQHITAWCPCWQPGHLCTTN